MNLLTSSGFIMAAVALLGALTFALISIDRSKVESVLIVGDLSEAQLISVKNQLEQLVLVILVLLVWLYFFQQLELEQFKHI